MTLPRRELPRRALALALGLAAALALLWAGLRWSRGREQPLGLALPTRALRERLARGIDPAAVEWVRRFPDSKLERFRIPRELADELWEGKFGAMTEDEFDPFSYYRSKPDLDVEHEWPAHPSLSWRYRTNSLGLRRDGDILAARPDLRILIAGDSHTDGVCDNSESFASLLESALRARRPEKTVEVLNAGKFGYSFYHYLGALERFEALRPHAAVVVVYGGNDFEESLTYRHLFEGTPRPEGTKHYRQQFRRACEVSRPPLGQGLIALKYFQLHPREAELALDTALEVTLEMQRVARAGGFELAIAYLPPRTDLPWGEQRGALERIAAILELSEDDLRAGDRMADAYLARLREAGIAAVDLRPALAEDPDGSYWREDLHLGLAGHARVARALEPLAARWLPEEQ